MIDGFGKKKVERTYQFVFEHYEGAATIVQ
jgi:hypothetical protein